MANQPMNLSIKWNKDNHSSILNIDGSCLDSPIRTGYGSVLRNKIGFYLSRFSGYNIPLTFFGLSYKGLMLAKEMDITELVCYSDSLYCINLIKGPNMMFHVYVVLLQDIKDLIEQSNVTIYHNFLEGH